MQSIFRETEKHVKLNKLSMRFDNFQREDFTLDCNLT